MSKYRVFVLMGKFACGKTTIAKLLELKYGMKRVVTCTTRSMREGERNGVDYYFYDDETFEKMASENRLVAINRVPVVTSEGNCEGTILSNSEKDATEGIEYSKKYGIPVEEINLRESSYICVLEPSGYFDLVNKLGKDKVKSIYLKLNDKERWLRALNREVNPDVDTIAKKHFEEYKLYDGIEDLCDKVIDNAGTSDKAAIDVYEYIKEFDCIHS